MADLPSVTTGLIEKVQIGENVHNIASTAYAECNTPAATAIKSVLMAGFHLEKGVTIHVKFIYPNEASTTPYLEVNGTGPKIIKLYGDQDAGVNNETDGWQAGAIISLTYDGTYWVRDQGYNTNTTYTIQNTYSGTDENPISGKGVKAAIETLDINQISNTAGKTVETITEQDGIVGATFQDIQITESQVTNLTTDLDSKMPKNGGTFTGNVSFNQGITLTINEPTTANEAASKGYVDNKTLGLTGALHYINIVPSTVTVTPVTPTEMNPNPDDIITMTWPAGTSYTPSSGDVISYNRQEYLYTGQNWRLLGDEGSYALKSKFDSAIKTLNFSQGTKPTLTVASVEIPNITNVGSTPTLGAPISVGSASGWNEGSITDASVSNGTLRIILGTPPTISIQSVNIPNVTSVGSTPTLGTKITVGSASNWNDGTLPSVNPSSIDVVVP